MLKTIKSILSFLVSDGRSHWYRGWLWAEANVRDYGLPDTEEYIERCMWGVPGPVGEFDKGAMDYTFFYHNRLREVLGGQDK